MKRKRFAEEQIIGTLKEFVAGAVRKKVSRRSSTGEQTICRWNAEFGEMRVGDAKQHALGDVSPVRSAETKLSGGLHRTEFLIPELAWFFGRVKYVDS